jgi:hypothetical protein
MEGTLYLEKSSHEQMGISKMVYDGVSLFKYITFYAPRMPLGWGTLEIRGPWGQGFTLHIKAIREIS